MRELSGNNRAVFTQAAGYNAGVILGTVTHSGLQHGVAAATHTTVMADCWSQQSERF